MKFAGAITALITPFKNHTLDEEGLASNIRHQIEQGINGVLSLGITGEAPTISEQEEKRVISITVKEAKGKIPVWIGTGFNCAKKTIEKTQRAQDLGADAVLIVTPYYNKPTQEGIYRYFEAITNNTQIPIVIYNTLGRSGVNIETHTLLRIAQLPNILGVKETSGDIDQAGDVLHTVVKKFPNFLVFSGDDSMTLPMMALGGSGIISVVSNLVPAQVVALVKAASQGDFDMARKIHYQLLPLFKAAFVETNPIPIKAAMSLCGMPSGDCRLPLYQMAPENLDRLKQLLLEMKLMSAYSVSK